MRAWFHADDLTLSYGATAAVAGVSLRVDRGQSVALVGASGSGKSTLLHLLAGVEVPDSGDVWFDGVRLSHASDAVRSRLRLERFGFVFQFGDLVPELTLAENIALPLELLGRRNARARVSDLVDALDLGGCRDQRPARVSGGQRQRAAVARAIAHEPDVIFADEPTGSLDSANGVRVLNLLLSARGDSALVMVTHDPLVASRCDRIVTMADGRLSALSAGV